MKPFIEKGFLIYRNAPSSLVIACLHAGPSFESIVNRDENTDVAGGFLWKNIGGSLIVVSLPRSRMWGIDFNRGIPKADQALEIYNDYFNNPDINSKLNEFRKKYAWAAANEEDYATRLGCYQKFWEEVCLGNEIILLHRQHSCLKNVPSMIDFTSFGSIKNQEISKATRFINKKYSVFLDKTQYDYRRMIAFESKRRILQLMKLFGNVNPKIIGPSYREALEKDLAVAYKYADKIAINNIRRSFNENTLFQLIENALHHIPVPRITHEFIFRGELSHGPLNKLFPFNGKKILQVECSSFLLYWHPVVAADMITDLYNLLMKP
ncbi:MAG: hypothetical protein AABW49_03320 [Nanoarchaeota archaeon]